MFFIRTFSAGLALAVISVSSVSADVKVVASIKPVHSLVSGVMQGVGTPALIVEGAGSPHTYSLKPSQARALQSADVIFWVGHDLEPFLEKPLETLGGNARVIELIDADGIATIEVREGGAFDTHDHGHGHEEEHERDHKDEDAHEHDHKDEHADAHKDEHDHKDEHADSHKDEDDHKDAHEHEHEGDHKDEHADAHGHEDGEVDLHIWLDPENAQAMVLAIRDTLVAADPANTARYRSNAERLVAELGALTGELAATLAPVKAEPFVVFHDGYQYFEKRFGLNTVGAITVSPDVVPGAKRISEIREKLQDLGAGCVFAEPQFTPKLIDVVAEGTGARTGVLDPLGASHAPGEGLYLTLMRDMAASMRDCLSPRS